METTLSSEAVQQLIQEIRNLHSQYAVEVPKPRGPWPESIKARVRELWALGLSHKVISEATGVPAQTMYSWKYNGKPGFTAVAVAKIEPVEASVQLSQSENLPIKSQTKISEPKILTVTVVMPNGVRLEGLDQAAALKFAFGSMR